MRIYVGNLPDETTDHDVRYLFSQHGAVDDVQLPLDPGTGRAKGFAFVEMPDDEEARAAVTALDGKQRGSRTLTVNQARPAPAPEALTLQGLEPVPKHVKGGLGAERVFVNTAGALNFGVALGVLALVYGLYRVFIASNYGECQQYLVCNKDWAYWSARSRAEFDGGLAAQMLMPAMLWMGLFPLLALGGLLTDAVNGDVKQAWRSLCRRGDTGATGCEGSQAAIPEMLKPIQYAAILAGGVLLLLGFQVLVIEFLRPDYFDYGRAIERVLKESLPRSWSSSLLGGTLVEIKRIRNIEEPAWDVKKQAIDGNLNEFRILAHVEGTCEVKLSSIKTTFDQTAAFRIAKDRGGGWFAELE